MTDRPSLFADHRGVSSALGYVLTLAISGILVTGLLVAGGSMVTSERDVVANEQLTVAAEQLATGMTDADRMAAANNGGTVRIEVWLPDDAGSAPYSIRLDSQTTPAGQPNTTRIVAELRALDISQSVVVRTSFAVADVTVDGGPVVVSFDTADRKLHVHDADDVAMNLGGATLAFSPTTGGVSQLSVGDVPSSAASEQAAAFDATTGDIS